MLVGHEFFFTFDGLAYNFTGSCVYLLAADLVDGNFSVSLQYNNASSSEDSPPSFTIIVTAGHKSYNTLIIDMDHNVSVLYILIKHFDRSSYSQFSSAFTFSKCIMHSNLM